MRVDTAAAVAITANVSLDWLILGRRPEDVPPIDESLLRDVLEVVEEYLDEHSVTIPTTKKALLICHLYMIILEGDDKTVSTKSDLVSRFIRMAV